MGTRSRIPQTELLAQSALVTIGILIPLAVVFVYGPGPAATANSIQVTSSLATVGAGAALFGCWKIGGRAAAGWLGIGLIDLGILTMLYRNFSFPSLSPFGLVEPFGRLLLCVVVVGCIFAALASPEVDAGLKPLSALALTALIGFAGLAVLNWTLTGPFHPDEDQSLVQASLLACALLWLGLGMFSAIARRARQVPAGSWLGWFILCRLCGSVVGALLVRDAWGAVLMQTAYLLSAAVALVASAWELRHTVQGKDRYSLDLSTVLRTTRANIERERAELDERLHDLRNAVAGVRYADSTLRTYASRLDDETRVQLSEALSSELSRLQTLIEPDRELRSEQFCLSEALNPVLITERSRGSIIDAQIAPVHVEGDTDAVAQVMQNLLTNARLYAPESVITISVEQIVDRVVLRVSDDGPGIPDDERSRIFERGTRGSTSFGTQGTGIGLSVAARLMRQMGGGLYLAGDVVGATFVAELPAARSSVPAEFAQRQPIASQN